MPGFFIKRTNITAEKDIYIGKKFHCGKNAEPYDTYSAAKSALRRQIKQDKELCPDCFIKYEITQKKENNS